MAQISTTVADSLDLYIESLCFHLKTSKSSLCAAAIERGIASIAREQIIERDQCEAIITKEAKAREKTLAGPAKGRKSNIAIEYVAEVAAE